MRLHGLMRTGEREKAIRFLQETRNVSRQKAETPLGVVEASLGIAVFAL